MLNMLDVWNLALSYVTASINLLTYLLLVPDCRSILQLLRHLLKTPLLIVVYFCVVLSVTFWLSHPLMSATHRLSSWSLWKRDDQEDTLVAMETRWQGGHPGRRGNRVVGLDSSEQWPVSPQLMEVSGTLVVIMRMIPSPKQLVNGHSRTDHLSMTIDSIEWTGLCVFACSGFWS